MALDRLMSLMRPKHRREYTLIIIKKEGEFSYTPKWLSSKEPVKLGGSQSRMCDRDMPAPWPDIPWCIVTTLLSQIVTKQDRFHMTNTYWS